MIFKTFNSDIDKLTSKIGIFGKSFSAIFDAKKQRKIDIDDLMFYKGMPLDQAQKQVGSFWSYLYPKREDIQNQLIDVMPEINANDISATTEKIKAMASSVSKNKTTWQEWFDALPDGEKHFAQLGQHMESQIITTEGVVKANQQARASAIAHNEAIKAQTFSAKAGKVALQALATAGNMLAMWGVTEAISVIYSCATASDRLKGSASDLGSQFSSAQSGIEGYKTRINDLYKTINDNSSSYEDTYNARQGLLTIQDEMIEKFGSEAEAVQLVTTAINGSTEALDSLTKQKWQETVNSFSFDPDRKWTDKAGDGWANLWSGSSNNFDRMINEMENTQISFHIIPLYGNKSYEEFSQRLKEDFGASLTKTQRDDMFTLSGGLNDIYGQLLTIQSLAKDMGIDDSFLPDLSRQAEEAKNTLESYQEIYSQHILYDRIFNSEAYEQSFNDINDAYKEYQEAFSSGGEESIEKAKQSFAEVVHGATEGITDDSVVGFFEQMYPDLQAVVSGWEFELRFKAAIEDDKDNFENDVSNYVPKFRTSGDILNFNAKTATDEQIQAYNSLRQLATDYGTDIDNLIVRLEQLGLIAPQVNADIRNSIRSISDDHGISDRGQYAGLIEYTKDFTEEEKKLWLDSTKGAENATQAIGMYEAALKEAQQTTNGAGISSLSITDTIIQLNTHLKPAFDSLRSAYQGIFTDDGGFALESKVILSTFDTIKSKLDEMSDPEGLNLDVDYSAFEDFVGVLNNAESQEQDVENAFSSLAASITQAAPLRQCR